MLSLYLGEDSMAEWHQMLIALLPESALAIKKDLFELADDRFFDTASGGQCVAENRFFVGIMIVDVERQTPQPYSSEILILPPLVEPADEEETIGYYEDEGDDSSSSES